MVELYRRYADLSGEELWWLYFGLGGMNTASRRSRHYVAYPSFSNISSKPTGRALYQVLGLTARYPLQRIHRGGETALWPPGGVFDADGGIAARRIIPLRRTRRHTRWATLPGTFLLTAATKEPGWGFAPTLPIISFVSGHLGSRDPVQERER